MLSKLGSRIKPGAAAFAALVLSASAVQAADQVSVAMDWIVNGTHAGYFVAKDKGYYTEENLDVTILPGGPDIAPTQVIAGGGAGRPSMWMMRASWIISRSNTTTPGA